MNRTLQSRLLHGSLCPRLLHGEMAERFNAAVLKTAVGQPTVGSNPTLSAKLLLCRAQASHFGCGSVTQTSDANAVLQALSEGHPVISSQRAGLFTSGGHFIVLRGITANGKVLVNDPNDSNAKNYINREFDMMSEIHVTANAYWIFDKK